MKHYLVAVLLALVAVLLAVPARAGDCRRVVAVQHNAYVAPTVNYGYVPTTHGYDAFAVKYLTVLPRTPRSGTNTGSPLRPGNAKELHSLIQATSRRPRQPVAHRPGPAESSNRDRRHPGGAVRGRHTGSSRRT